MIKTQIVHGNNQAIVDDWGRILTFQANTERDVAQGRVDGRMPFHRFGFNATVASGTVDDIWSYGPTDRTYNWLTTADELRLAAGNVNDDAGGSGALTVNLIYLDEYWNTRSETLLTNGTSASLTTSKKAIRFIRASVEQTGTILGNNTGNIIIETEGGTAVGFIAAGIGQTEMTMYTVPAGFNAYLVHVDINVSVGTNRESDIQFWQRPNADVVSAPFSAKKLVGRWIGVDRDIQRDYHAQPCFTPKTDIWLDGSASASSAAISVDYDLDLVRIT